MGLLDQFLSGQYSQDPDQNAALKQGLLAAGFGLLGSKGSLSSALGQAGQAGMGAYEGAQDSQQARKLRAFQLQQMTQEAQRKTQMQQLAQQFYRAPSQSGVDATGGMDTATSAPKNQAGPGGFNFDGYANAMAQFDPMQALQIRSATQKDDAPVKLAPGETLLSGKASGFKPLAFNPKDVTPSDVGKLIAEMNALPPNDPRRSIYMQAIQKATTHTPGTNVSINTAKPLLNTVAEGLGKQIDTSLSDARAATSSIQTAQTLRSAVDTGKIVAGPGASFRVFGLQLGQALGVGGKDGAEVLSNTRTAIQAMAKSELEAAQMMKGQGQITEAERDIIRRAAAGDIDKLTAPEVRQLSDTMEKTARFKIKTHQSNLKALSTMPNAAPLLPFYQVEEPAAYKAPAGAGGVRRYNPATGRLE